MMESLDGLALLLPGHRRAVHYRATHREGPLILLIPDPDDVFRTNRWIRLRDPRGHHVRAVVDEPDRSHVDRHGALRRREREEAADRRSEPVPDDERGRLLAAQQDTTRTC